MASQENGTGVLRDVTNRNNLSQTVVKRTATRETTRVNRPLELQEVISDIDESSHESPRMELSVDDAQPHTPYELAGRQARSPFLLRGVSPVHHRMEQRVTLEDGSECDLKQYVEMVSKQDRERVMKEVDKLTKEGGDVRSIVERAIDIQQETINSLRAQFETFKIYELDIQRSELDKAGATIRSLSKKYLKTRDLLRESVDHSRSRYSELWEAYLQEYGDKLTAETKVEAMEILHSASRQTRKILLETVQDLRTRLQQYYNSKGDMAFVEENDKLAQAIAKLEGDMYAVNHSSQKETQELKKEVKLLQRTIQQKDDTIASLQSDIDIIRRQMVEADEKGDDSLIEELLNSSQSDAEGVNESDVRGRSAKKSGYGDLSYSRSMLSTLDESASQLCYEGNEGGKIFEEAIYKATEELKEQVQKLEKEREAWQRTKSELLNSFEIQSQELESLRIEGIQKENEFEDLVRTFEDEISSLREDLERAQETNSDSSNEMEKLRNKNESLLAQIDSLAADCDSLSAKCDDLTSKNARLVAVEASLSGKVKELNIEIKQTKQSRSERETRLVREIDSLRSSHTAEVKREKEASLLKMQELERECEKLKNKLSQVESEEMTKLSELLEQRKDLLEEREKRICLLSTQLETLKDEIASLRTFKERATERENTLQNRAETAEEGLKTQTTEVKRLKEIALRASEERSDLEKEAAVQSEKAAKLEAQLADREQSLSRLEASQSEWENRLEAETQKWKKIVKEKDNRIQQLAASLESSKIDMLSLRHQQESLTDKVKDSERGRVTESILKRALVRVDELARHQLEQLRKLRDEGEARERFMTESRSRSASFSLDDEEVPVTPRSPSTSCHDESVLIISPAPSPGREEIARVNAVAESVVGVVERALREVSTKALKLRERAKRSKDRIQEMEKQEKEREQEKEKAAEECRTLQASLEEAKANLHGKAEELERIQLTLSEISTSVEILTDEKKSLTSEISSLSSNLSGVASQKKLLEDRLSVVEHELSRAVTERDRRAEEALVLNEAVSKKQTDTELLERKICELQTRIEEEERARQENMSLFAKEKASNEERGEELKRIRQDLLNTEEELFGLGAENNHLQLQVTERTEALRLVERVLTETEGRCTDLERELEEETSQRALLEVEFGSIKMEMETLSCTLAEKEEALSAALAKGEEERDNVCRAIREKLAAQLKVEAAEKSAEKANRRAADAKKQKDDLAVEASSLTAEVATLNSEVAHLREQLFKLEQDGMEAEAESSSLQEEAARLREEAEKLRARTVELEGLLSAAEERKAALSDELLETKSRLEEEQNVAGSLKKEKEELDNKVNEQDLKLHSVESERQSLASLVDTLESNIQRHSEESIKMQDTIEELSICKKELTENLLAREELVADLRQQLESTTSDLQDVSQRASKLDGEVLELEKELRDTKDTLTKTNARATASNSTIEDLAVALESRKEEVRNLQNAMARLREAYEGRGKSIESLKSRLSYSEEENNSLRCRIEEIETEVEDSRRERVLKRASKIPESTLCSPSPSVIRSSSRSASAISPLLISPDMPSEPTPRRVASLEAALCDALNKKKALEKENEILLSQKRELADCLHEMATHRDRGARRLKFEESAVGGSISKEDHLSQELKERVRSLEEELREIKSVLSDVEKLGEEAARKSGDSLPQTPLTPRQAHDFLKRALRSMSRARELEEKEEKLRCEVEMEKQRIVDDANKKIKRLESRLDEAHGHIEQLKEYIDRQKERARNLEDRQLEKHAALRREFEVTAAKLETFTRENERWRVWAISLRLSLVQLGAFMFDFAETGTEELEPSDADTLRNLISSLVERMTSTADRSEKASRWKPLPELVSGSVSIRDPQNSERGHETAAPSSGYARYFSMWREDKPPREEQPMLLRPSSFSERDQHREHHQVKEQNYKYYGFASSEDLAFQMRLNSVAVRSSEADNASRPRSNSGRYYKY